MIFTVIAFLMGIITAIYIPMNSAVAKHLGSSIAANIFFFCLALLTTLMFSLATKEFSAVANFREVPTYLYLTGIISGFIVLGSTVLIPLLGARKFFVLFVAGQILMALVVSHLGILESVRDPITLKKIIGASFVVIGVVISVIK